MSTWHGVMADGEEFMQWKISTNTVYNTLKTDTKYSHSVRSRPTLKDKECFRNGLVRKPYERSLYERTLMSEPSFHRVACRTGGLAGPARYTSARAKRENEREARDQKKSACSHTIVYALPPP